MAAYVYILRCLDGKYYVGSTCGTLERRVAEHNAGTFGGFTSRRRPVELIFSEHFDRITDAISAERRLKGWSRAKKEAYMRGEMDTLATLAKRKKKGVIPMTDMWSEEYWAHKGDVKLYMFRKRLGAPAAGETPKPILFLVHGSSFCGRTGFDLHVPGKTDYSLMEKFAEYGYDLWTMDHEGYGRSDSTDGNSPVAEGVRDLKAGLEIVMRETGQSSLAFYGSSSGALRAAAFAEHYPDHVNNLVLDAFVWTGKDAPTLIERAKKLDIWTASNMRAVDKPFFLSIFTRDKPGTCEDGVGDACADAELAICNAVPTGTYVDMCANLPVCDPTKIKCPVLIIRGEHDGVATEEDLLNYFDLLPNRNKQFAIIAGQAHVSHLGVNRARFWHVMRRFLEMPERIDSSGL